MKQGIVSTASVTMSAKDISPNRTEDEPDAVVAKGESGDALLATHGQLRNAWMARFAVGVADDTKFTRETLSLDELLVATKHWGPEASGTKFKLVHDAHPTEERHHRHKRSKELTSLINQDIAEVQSLRPVLSLAEMAERALELDRQWKQKLLGLPKGLSEDMYGDDMLKVMLKEGIRVPMQAGNAVGMRV